MKIVHKPHKRRGSKSLYSWLKSPHLIRLAMLLLRLLVVIAKFIE